MAFGLKRTDLQEIARVKLDDAIFLLQHHRFANAYYLAGYAVELALKAVIARSMAAEVIPDKAFVAAIYGHDLRQLVNLAGLTTDLSQIERADAIFATNWALAARWQPAHRYQTIPSSTAEVTVQAIADPEHGVFRWTKKHW
jgi:hypothetical protein